MKLLVIGASLLFNLACAKSIDVAELNDRMDEIESRVGTLEQTIQGDILDLETLSYIVTLLEDTVDENNADQLAAVAALTSQAEEQQLAIDDLILELAVLQGHTQIDQIIDPCGDGSGYDEVVLKLTDGSFLAYFEQGSKRFLSIIPNGSYQTTDQQACSFTILNGVLN